MKIQFKKTILQRSICWALYLLFSTALFTTAYSQNNETQPIQSEGVACTLKAKVIKVTDGDTVNVLDADKKTHKIRLAGIDAPERRQAYGQAAKKFLANLINQKTVCVEWHKQDRYGRLVGVIKYQGRDINLEIMKAGYAWHYKKYQREQKPVDRALYSNAEIQAHSDVIGLWSEPNPINPSDWRKGTRKAPITKIFALQKQTPENFTCGTKRFCGQMSSCDEACFYLQQCGMTRLDGNSDGIPCNKLCNSACDF